MRWLNYVVIILFGQQGFAAPILNKNVSLKTAVATIFVDHEDSNHYYYGPNSYQISRDDNNVPNFSFNVYRKRLLKKRAIVQMLLEPAQNSDLEKAKEEILLTNPNARFSSITYEGSFVSFASKVFKDFFIESDCQKLAGRYADTLSCSFLLNRKGIKYLKYSILSGKAYFVDVKYHFIGFIEDQDGHLSAQMGEYQVAANVSTSDILDYPQLFRGLDLDKDDD